METSPLVAGIGVELDFFFFSFLAGFGVGSGVDSAD
jgi:hypothetical protein